MNNTLIVLTGPTGVGKTALSLELANHYNCDIISCDSRQFYKEMTIGTAVPGKHQLESVRHHFVQFLSVTDYYSASLFERDVIELLPKLFRNNPVVIMTGGSMLYIDAVCKGMDDIPDIDHSARKKYHDLYNAEGIAGLRLALKILDPGYYAKADLHNPRRLQRALEITETTGKPYSSFLTSGKRTRSFNIIKAGLTLDRNELYDRINARVDTMIGSGLVEEAKKLIQHRNHNALNTVGYRELFSFFDGEITLEKAVELIKRNTRRYARKQLTWWSKDNEIRWCDAGNTGELKIWLYKETANKNTF